jgi:NAD(P)-dependent dehydrogenase (short-subunit alcohol dehydrogenase family)
MDLKGAVALVTGGNGGLGQRICHALASEGVHVAVMYAQSRDQAEGVARELASSYQINAAAFACDITDGAAVQQLIGELTRRFGRLDILVNNAAYNKSVPRRPRIWQSNCCRSSRRKGRRNPIVPIPTASRPVSPSDALVQTGCDCMRLALGHRWIAQRRLLRRIGNYADFDKNCRTSCRCEHGKLVICEYSAIPVHYGTVLSVDRVSMVVRRLESCVEHLVSDELGASNTSLKIYIPL